MPTFSCVLYSLPFAFLSLSTRLISSSYRSSFSNCNLISHIWDSISSKSEGRRLPITTFGARGGALIKAECQHRVGVKEVLTEHKVNEIIGHIQRTTYCDRKIFNREKWVINLEDGLLDVRTKRLKTHTSQFLSTIRIPVTYDSRAYCQIPCQYSQRNGEQHQGVFAYLLPRNMPSPPQVELPLHPNAGSSSASPVRHRSTCKRRVCNRQAPGASRSARPVHR